VLQDQKENSANYRLDGVYRSEQAELTVFDCGEFFLGDMDVEHMTLSIRFTITVRRRKVVSKFELKGQGRAFQFEPIDDIIPGKRLEFDVVQRI
jgi:hypothetical protein